MFDDTLDYLFGDILLVDCAYVNRNIINTLLLNQLNIRSVKSFPRIVRVVPFFFNLNLSDPFNSYYYSKLFYFLFFSFGVRCRWVRKKYRFRGQIRYGYMVKVVLRSDLIFSFLYALFCFIVPKLDIFKIFAGLSGFGGKFYKFKWRRVFHHRVVYERAIVRSLDFFSDYYVVRRLPCVMFKMFDLRGVSFFDRCALFLKWRDAFSVLCVVRMANVKRSERMLLFRNWKLRM